MPFSPPRDHTPQDKPNACELMLKPGATGDNNMKRYINSVETNRIQHLHLYADPSTKNLKTLILCGFCIATDNTSRYDPKPIETLELRGIETLPSSFESFLHLFSEINDLTVDGVTDGSKGKEAFREAAGTVRVKTLSLGAKTDAIIVRTLETVLSGNSLVEAAHAIVIRPHDERNNAILLNSCKLRNGGYHCTTYIYNGGNHLTPISERIRTFPSHTHIRTRRIQLVFNVYEATSKTIAEHIANWIPSESVYGMVFNIGASSSALLLKFLVEHMEDHWGDLRVALQTKIDASERIEFVLYIRGSSGGGGVDIAEAKQCVDVARKELWGSADVRSQWDSWDYPEKDKGQQQCWWHC